MQLKTVVFPAPFGPIRPTTLFLGTLIETFVNASTPPKATDRFEMSNRDELTRRF